VAKQPKRGTPALLELQRASVAFTAHEFEPIAGEHRYGLAAADALGVEPGRVFKTLVTMADGRGAVGIVPVDRQLSLKAIAAALGAKRAEIAEVAVAERITGYVVGGISPFGQKRRLPTVLDASAVAFATIYVSGGRRGLDVELAPASLVAVLAATVAPISA
jgi:Cys-tRNA(Pro)/Cys-tRNA(Cys) deacylase